MRRQPSTRAPASLDERFFSKVHMTDGCWVWTGATTRGYGVIGRTGLKGGRAYSHRIAYEQIVGPIPAGMEIDHLCRNRACVRPDHLEPVTKAENNRRRDAALGIGDFAVTCGRGHPLDETNTYVEKGIRCCRECRRERSRRSYWRNNTRSRQRGPYKTSTRSVASEEGGPAEAERVGYAPADQPPSSHSRERREPAQPKPPRAAAGAAPLSARSA